MHSKRTHTVTYTFTHIYAPPSGATTPPDGHARIHACTHTHMHTYPPPPYQVRLRYAFQTDTHIFLVLNYVAGGSLDFHLQRWVWRGGGGYAVAELFIPPSRAPSQPHTHLHRHTHTHTHTPHTHFSKKRFPEHWVQLYAAELFIAIESLHSRNILHRCVVGCVCAISYVCVCGVAISCASVSLCVCGVATSCVCVCVCVCVRACVVQRHQAREHHDPRRRTSAVGALPDITTIAITITITITTTTTQMDTYS